MAVAFSLSSRAALISLDQKAFFFWVGATSYYKTQTNNNRVSPACVRISIDPPSSSFDMHVLTLISNMTIPAPQIQTILMAVNAKEIPPMTK